MANPAYGPGAFMKDRMIPVEVEGQNRKARKEAELLAAYAEVDRLDQSVCWVTGTVTIPGAPDRKTRREHHHLKGRRVRPEWVTDVNRIITVTRLAHQLITKGWIVVEGDDRRKRIIFHWAEHVTPEMRPKGFRIRSKRRSQNR